MMIFMIWYIQYSWRDASIRINDLIYVEKKKDKDWSRITLEGDSKGLDISASYKKYDFKPSEIEKKDSYC